MVVVDQKTKNIKHRMDNIEILGRPQYRSRKLQEDEVAALGGFNIGVELGQLVIVLVFLPLAWLLRRTFVYRWLVVVGGSIVIILIGTYWILERSGIAI